MPQETPKNQRHLLAEVRAWIARAGAPAITVRIGAIAVAVALAAVLAIGPARTSAEPLAQAAGCGGIDTATTHSWHNRSLPPLAIGDSTLILSLPGLAREGIDGNAHGCRQYGEALRMLSGLRSRGELPRVVIVALGANGQVSQEDVNRALAILGPGRILVMVTHLDPGFAPGSDTGLIRSEARRHPGRVVVLDWIRYSSGHGGWFQPDGLHLTYSGAEAFAHLLATVLPLATPVVSLAPPKCHGPAAANLPPSSLSLRGSRGVLDLKGSSRTVAVTVRNTASEPLPVSLSLRLLTHRAPIVAARCVLVPARSNARVELVLSRHAVTDAALLGRLDSALTVTPDVTGTPARALHGRYRLIYR